MCQARVEACFLPGLMRGTLAACGPGTEEQEWAVWLLAKAPAISVPALCAWPQVAPGHPWEGGEQRRALHAQVPTHHGADGRGSGARLGLLGLRGLGSGPRK